MSGSVLPESSGDFIVIDHTGPCWVCDGSTSHVEINLHAYMHPSCGEAEDAMRTERYMKGVQRLVEDYNEVDP